MSRDEIDPCVDEKDTCTSNPNWIMCSQTQISCIDFCSFCSQKDHSKSRSLLIFLSDKNNEKYIGKESLCSELPGLSSWKVIEYLLFFR